MDPKVQAFIQWCKDNATEAYNLISEEKFNVWANGGGSLELNKVYALWQAGQYNQVIENLDQFTDVTNPLNAPMKNYDVYGPEEAALRNMIQTLNDEIATYKANGGTDTGFINVLTRQIKFNQDRLDEYTADQGAIDSTKPTS